MTTSQKYSPQNPLSDITNQWPESKNNAGSPHMPLACRLAETKRQRQVSPPPPKMSKKQAKQDPAPPWTTDPSETMNYSDSHKQGELNPDKPTPTPHQANQRGNPPTPEDTKRTSGDDTDGSPTNGHSPLKESTPKHQHYLRIAFYNVEGLNAGKNRGDSDKGSSRVKHDCLAEFLDHNDLDICFLSETWVQKEGIIKHFPGYRIVPTSKSGQETGKIRNLVNSTNAPSGGVAFLIKDAIPVSQAHVVKPSEDDHGAIWLTVTDSSGYAIHICGVYNEDEAAVRRLDIKQKIKNLWTIRRTTLDSFDASDAVLLAGDLNIHLKRLGSAKDKNCNGFDTTFLSNAPRLSLLNKLNEPTCFHNFDQASGAEQLKSLNQPSCIDLAVTRTKDKDSFTMKVPPSLHRISKHRPLLITYKLTAPLLSDKDILTTERPEPRTRLTLLRTNKELALKVTNALELQAEKWHQAHPEGWNSISTTGFSSRSDCPAQTAYNQLITGIQDTLRTVLGETSPGESTAMAQHKQKLDKYRSDIESTESDLGLASSRGERAVQKIERLRATLTQLYKARMNYCHQFHVSNTRKLLREIDKRDRSRESSELFAALTRISTTAAGNPTIGRQVFPVFTSPPSLSTSQDPKQPARELATHHKDISKRHGTHLGNIARATKRSKKSRTMTILDQTLQQLSSKGGTNMTIPEKLERPPHALQENNQCQNLPKLQELQNILNNKFTLADLEMAIQKCSLDTAPGQDTLTYRVLATFGVRMRQVLLSLYNYCLDTATVPESFKIAQVTPLFKYNPVARRNDTKEVGNYRGISLLETMSKLLERLVLTRILTFTTNWVPLHPSQQGFREGCDSASLCFSLIDILKLRNQNNMPVVLCDQSKAFDACPHSSMITALWHKGINGSILQMAIVFLTGYCDTEPSSHLRRSASNPKPLPRRCEVCVGTATSRKFEIQRGTAQGSISSPFFYAAHIDRIAQLLQAKNLGY